MLKHNKTLVRNSLIIRKQDADFKYGVQCRKSCKYLASVKFVYIDCPNPQKVRTFSITSDVY